VHRYLDIPLDERLAWLDNIPESIRKVPQWLTFKLEKDEDGKYDKVPYYIDGGKRYGKQGDEDDRSRLTTFNRALACVRDGRAHGIGFAPLLGGPVSLIDFDGAASCVRHARILSRTWSETSVGGVGAHAMVLGDLGSNRKDRKNGIELFSTKGFVALTGEPIVDECGEIRGKSVAASLVNGTQYEPQHQTPQQAALKATLYNEHERAKIIDAFRAFKCIKADYEQWIKVGQALHSADPSEDGPTFKLWLRWSKRDGERYKGEDDLLYHWRSFKSHGITLATLYGLAKEAKPARQRPKRLDNGDGIIHFKDIDVIDYGKLRFAIEDFIPEGLMLLVGKPKKAHKTFFALQCMAMASIGDAFLGYNPPQPLRCMGYMLEEGGTTFDKSKKEVPALDMVKRRLQNMGLRADALKGDVVFRTELLPLQDGGLDQIEHDAQSYDLIFIDSRQMIFNEDADQSRSATKSDYQQLEPIHNLARKYHCTIIVICHASKISDQNDAIDAIATTGGTAASADGVITLQNPTPGSDRIRLTLHHRQAEFREIELHWDTRTCRFEKVGPWLGAGKPMEVLSFVCAETERNRAPSTIQVASKLYGALKSESNRPNVSGWLAQLRRDGMVVSSESDDDARTKVWRATPAALARFVD